MNLSGYNLTIINTEGDEKRWVSTREELIEAIDDAFLKPTVLRCIVTRPK